MQFVCARWWCRFIAWSIFARIHVTGSDHIRPGQPYVYMANHSSLIDTPALFGYLPHQFRIMAKKKLFYIPFLGWHLWTGGHFPIDRGDARKTARSVRRVIDGVRTGKSLAVFPSDGPRLQLGHAIRPDVLDRGNPRTPTPRPRTGPVPASPRRGRGSRRRPAQCLRPYGGTRPYRGRSSC